MVAVRVREPFFTRLTSQENSTTRLRGTDIPLTLVARRVLHNYPDFDADHHQSLKFEANKVFCIRHVEPARVFQSGFYQQERPQLNVDAYECTSSTRITCSLVPASLWLTQSWTPSFRIRHRDASMPPRPFSSCRNPNHGWLVHLSSPLLRFFHRRVLQKWIEDADGNDPRPNSRLGDGTSCSCAQRGPHDVLRGISWSHPNNWRLECDFELQDKFETVARYVQHSAEPWRTHALFRALLRQQDGWDMDQRVASCAVLARRTRLHAQDHFGTCSEASSSSSTGGAHRLIDSSSLDAASSFIEYHHRDVRNSVVGLWSRLHSQLWTSRVYLMLERLPIDPPVRGASTPLWMDLDALLRHHFILQSVAEMEEMDAKSVADTASAQGVGYRTQQEGSRGPMFFSDLLCDRLPYLLTLRTTPIAETGKTFQQTNSYTLENRSCGAFIPVFTNESDLKRFVAQLYPARESTTELGNATTSPCLVRDVAFAYVTLSSLCTIFLPRSFQDIPLSILLNPGTRYAKWISPSEQRAMRNQQTKWMPSGNIPPTHAKAKCNSPSFSSHRFIDTRNWMTSATLPSEDCFRGKASSDWSRGSLCVAQKVFELQWLLAHERTLRDTIRSIRCYAADPEALSNSFRDQSTCNSSPPTLVFVVALRKEVENTNSDQMAQKRRCLTRLLHDDWLPHGCEQCRFQTNTGTMGCNASPQCQRCTSTLHILWKCSQSGHLFRTDLHGHLCPISSVKPSTILLRSIPEQARSLQRLFTRSVMKLRKFSGLRTEGSVFKKSLVRSLTNALTFLTPACIYKTIPCWELYDENLQKSLQNCVWKS